MTAILILAAVVGTFIVTSAGHVLLANHYLRLGFQLGRDDRDLDPGETTGQLPVGESSGRHALPDWPAHEATEQFEAVPQHG